METDPRTLDALDGFDPATHAREARVRWGSTDAWAQSALRTADRTPNEWHSVRDEAAEITERFGELHAAGTDPSDAVALAAAEDWRAHLSRWYYDVTPDLMRSLGDMYVADPRFTAYYDGTDGERGGLAEWVRDTLTAYADSCE